MKRTRDIMRVILIILAFLCGLYNLYLRDNKNYIDCAWVWIGISVILFVDFLLGSACEKTLGTVWCIGNLFLFVLLSLVVYIIWANGENTFEGSEEKIMILAGGFQRSGQLSTDTLARLQLALSLGDNNSEYIITGGLLLNGKREAELMKQEIIVSGGDADRIITDAKANDTHQNIVNCKRYLTDCDNTVVVSSRYHLLRIKMLLAKCGITGIHVAGARTEISLIPHNYVREICSLIRDTFYGWIDWSLLWR
jgi:uncharacterized SAM-binding protein YcdF (DUF218 family)